MGMNRHPGANLNGITGLDEDTSYYPNYSLKRLFILLNDIFLILLCLNYVIFTLSLNSLIRNWSTFLSTYLSSLVWNWLFSAAWRHLSFFHQLSIVSIGIINWVIKNSKQIILFLTWNKFFPKCFSFFSFIDGLLLRKSLCSGPGRK